jgi:two-component system response regulator AtoC
MLDQRTYFSTTAPHMPPVVFGNFPTSVKKSALRRRVLVVDDEALVRWAVTEVLTAAGYDVLEACDATSAIRTATDRRGQIDVVLLDLRLPDSRDLRLLEAMVCLAPTAAIVLMTAYGTKEIESEALRIGAWSVLAKPFDIVDLAPLVAGALGFRRS